MDRAEFSENVERRLKATHSRRRFLGIVAKGGVAAAGAVGALSLLAACGDDEDESTATTASGAGTATAMPEGTATTGEGDATATMGEEPTEPATEEPGTTPTGDTGAANPRYMGKTIEPAQSEGGTIIEVVAYSLDIFTPLEQVATFAESNYGTLIYETLIEPNPDTFEPVGNLASAWEASDDLLTWTFTLQEGVTFHDGEPFNAEDVKATYDLQLNPEAASTSHALISSIIESVEIVDDYTVAFQALEVVVDFPLTVMIYAIGAEHILSQFEPAELLTSAVNSGSDPSLIIGTGPFKFVSVTPGDQVVLTRNDDYWDGAPHLDGFIYQTVADNAVGLNLVLTGEADFIWQIDPAAVETVDPEQFKVTRFESTSVTCIYLNLDPEKTTRWQDQRVRQAMAWAVDRDALIEGVLFGDGIVGRGMISNLSWASDWDGLTVRYDYDPDMAGALLDEAGWVMGADGIREKDGEKFTFTLTTGDGFRPWSDSAVILQEQFRQIGIQVELELIANDIYFERFDNSEYEACIRQLPGSVTPEASIGNLRCTEYPDGFNSEMYCNEEVDALLDQALAEPDQEARIEIYRQAQDMILTDMPLVPLFTNFRVSVSNPGIHNHFPAQVNMNYNAETWWIEQ